MLRRLYLAVDGLLRRHLRTPPQRARIAVAGLLLACAGNAYLVRDLARLRRPERWQQWEPGPYLERLAAVRDALPVDARVGYLNLTYGDIASLKHDLFVTRFALAPRCVLSGTDAPYLLVQGEHAADVASGDRVVVLEDRARGVRLLEQAGAK